MDTNANDIQNLQREVNALRGDVTALGGALQLLVHTLGGDALRSATQRHIEVIDLHMGIIKRLAAQASLLASPEPAEDKTEAILAMVGALMEKKG